MARWISERKKKLEERDIDIEGTKDLQTIKKIFKRIFKMDLIDPETKSRLLEDVRVAFYKEYEQDAAILGQNAEFDFDRKDPFLHRMKISWMYLVAAWGNRKDYNKFIEWLALSLSAFFLVIDRGYANPFYAYRRSDDLIHRIQLEDFKLINYVAHIVAMLRKIRKDFPLRRIRNRLLAKYHKEDLSTYQRELLRELATLFD